LWTSCSHHVASCTGFSVRLGRACALVC